MSDGRRYEWKFFGVKIEIELGNVSEEQATEAGGSR